MYFLDKSLQIEKWCCGCENNRNEGYFYLLGVRVFIEKKAQLTLLGTEMDFVETKLTNEFIFNNPNIKGMCGCGESFSVWACEPTLNRKDWMLLRELGGGNIWSSGCACISSAVLPANHLIITGVTKIVLTLYFSITDLWSLLSASGLKGPQQFLFVSKWMLAILNLDAHFMQVKTATQSRTWRSYKSIVLKFKVSGFNLWDYLTVKRLNFTQCRMPVECF